MTDILTVTYTDTEIVLVEVSTTLVVDGQGDTIITDDGSTTIVTDTVNDIVTVEPDVITNVNVLTVGEQGPTGPPGAGTELFETRAEVVSDYLVYRAEAALGTTDTAALAWRIRKIDITYGALDFTPTTTWAEGSTGFTHAWDSRLSYTYS